MLVILLKDVKALGKANEIIEVNDGYAKNFLIRNKLAVPFNKVTDHQREMRVQEKITDEENKISTANNLKKEIEAKNLTFYLKAHNGISIGFITNKAITNELNKDTKLVNKYMFNENYKLGLGNHQIKLNLYKNIVAIVNIEIKEVK